MKRVLFLISIFILPHANAEEAAEKVIVKFKNLQSLAPNQIATLFQELDFDEAEEISQEQGIFLMQLGAKADIYRDRAEIQYIQRDDVLELRSKPLPTKEVIPNDPEFKRQWNLKNQDGGADIRATKAWTFGTGGQDSDGNEVVVAILDQGISLKQEEIRSSLWKNTREIVGNKIDDDGNGYVDDIRGWNPETKSDEIPERDHGTIIGSIIAAKGNNKKSMVGVTWGTKLMPIIALPLTTSRVAKGLTYVLKQKKLWLDTAGKKGANIVAVNLSFGVNFKKCTEEEFPIWNDLFDSLGEVGILSVAATVNDEIDVDQKGDVPTTCTSPYLLTVTSTNEKDDKADSAGYGLQSIDIGAPGVEILGLLNGGTVQTLKGTSYSAPHVTGAVAFLHSVANKDFLSYSRRNPGKAALYIKKTLMDYSDQNADLKKLIVSGGRLNLYKAAKRINAFTERKGNGSIKFGFWFEEIGDWLGSKNPFDLPARIASFEHRS